MKNILFVDDNVECLKLYKRIFRGKQYNLFTALNGQEAIELLNKNKIDGIISDILMPIMDGFKFCRYCKKDKNLRNIPFIFVTAVYTAKKDEEFAMGLGAQGFISKPFQVDTFVEDIIAKLKAPNVHSHREKSLNGNKDELEFLKEYSHRTIVKFEQTVEKLNEEFEKHRKIEKLLEKSERKYRNVVQNIREWVWEIDLNMNYKFSNGYVKEFLGYKPEEILKMRMIQLVPKEDKAQLMKRFQCCIDAPKSVTNAIIRFIHKDGSFRYSECTAVSCLNEEGEIVGYCGLGKNITQRLENEQRLNEQKQNLEQKTAALKEVLSQIEHEKQQIKDDIVSNIEQLIMPKLDKIISKGIQRQKIETIRNDLKKITASFGRKISSHALNLTAREIEVCDLIKNGLGNKEIASVLALSKSTVEQHRLNIRRKLGLANKEINLTTYLKTL